ncbi:hypothetical protein KW790_02030 [Candidatus Parcubacteria bacterium]|nr:hypothetical protein [Candidatus Parcubacteria bacterium]
MHDFVAIGDIVTDAFIKLREATVNCDINEEHCTITMKFGDKIPYESVEVIRAVGNSSNASVSAARLGLSSALVANIGADQNGKECLQTLRQNRVDTKYIKIHKGKETNYHYVLWYESDRTILVKHQAYKYKLPKLAEPKWIYLSSLADHTKDYHHEVAAYLHKHPGVKLAFQPGTFQMKLGLDELKDIYKRSQIFFCNVEEAERILGINTLGTGELLKRMRDLGPDMVVITDGPKGAYAHDGRDMWFVPPYPDQKPAFERTGAGDAFASTTVAALILGKDLPTALQWGAVNSMSVVQEVGAQKGLLSRKKLETLLKKAPEDFRPSPLK